MERKGGDTNFVTRYLSSDYERHDFGSQPKPLALDLKSGDQVSGDSLNFLEDFFNVGPLMENIFLTTFDDLWHGKVPKRSLLL